MHRRLAFAVLLGLSLMLQSVAAVSHPVPHGVTGPASASSAVPSHDHLHVRGASATKADRATAGGPHSRHSCGCGCASTDGACQHWAPALPSVVAAPAGTDDAGKSWFTLAQRLAVDARGDPRFRPPAG